MLHVGMSFIAACIEAAHTVNKVERKDYTALLWPIVGFQGRFLCGQFFFLYYIYINVLL